MAQLSDDCFAVGNELMPLHDALSEIRQRTSTAVDSETVPLASAYGRILARDIAAPISVPPHDNSAVDGYAFRFNDLAEGKETGLTLAGRTAAGHPLEKAVQKGECVRIFTGAQMPEGADTVLMQEDARVEGGTVYIPPGLKKGANRRKAGEDIAEGATVLKAGRRLSAADIGIAASVGCAALPVYRALRVALFSSGDELREPGETLPPGAIHDSNRYVLRGMLEQLGCAVDDLGILEDREASVRKALEKAARDHDLIVTSGGVSVGEEDHIKAAVEALGDIHFWRVAIKPGRPIALGQVAGAAFAGLPGNPVAVALTFLRIVKPMVERLSGAEGPQPRPVPVMLDWDLRKKPGRLEWVRVTVQDGESGGLPRAAKFERQGSGILSSVADSDGVLELAEDITDLKKGSIVPFLSFRELGL